MGKRNYFDCLVLYTFNKSIVLCVFFSLNQNGVSFTCRALSNPFSVILTHYRPIIRLQRVIRAYKAYYNKSSLVLAFIHRASPDDAFIISYTQTTPRF